MDDLKFEGQHIRVEEHWKERVQSRLEGLERGPRKIIHARVVFKKSTHHKTGDEEVSIILSVPGKILTTTKHSEVMQDALRHALDAMEEEWRHYWDRKRRSQAKAVLESGVVGVVQQIFRSGQYGFIQVENGEEVYFHKNSVRGISFDRLEIGLKVRCLLERGEKGMQASQVLIQ